MIFEDRREAGRRLAERLEQYRDRNDVLVLALPRGGVPVGFEVAHALRAPLDVLVVRKLGIPGREEFAMGAIASGGVRVVNQQAVSWFQIPVEVMNEVAAREELELQRREVVYRGRRPRPSVRGRIVLLVDDGIATGASMRAAARAVAARHPARLVVAVPVAPASVYEDLESAADEVIALSTPPEFEAVGEWYASFPQVSDAEVNQLLAEALPAHGTKA
jgi:predicted phosphoribosyltransferase